MRPPYASGSGSGSLPPQGFDGRQDEAVGVFLGDLVRFLLGLVEADQAALLAMEDHDRPERAVRLYLTLGGLELLWLLWSCFTCNRPWAAQSAQDPSA